MLVLASSSPRRRELLSLLGIAFEVQAADVDESRHPDEAPTVYAARLAREKALAVKRLRPGDAVLGADTIVVVDGSVLGKPADRDDARRMLRLLSGRSHEVITAVCVAAAERREHAETTSVLMSVIPDDELQAYVASGEPVDKAGAYAIQGGAAKWVYRIEGDYFNVVGLPVWAVWRMLRQG